MNATSYRNQHRVLRFIAKYRLTLIPAWISNYIYYKVRDDITYPFPNFNGRTDEVWDLIRKFTFHTGFYCACDYISVLVEGANG